MSKATVSIFMPSYNAGATLPSVFKRIPAELRPSLGGIHVIDDGSKDDTQAVLARLADEYPELRVFRFSENKGYGHAVRKGLDLCREDATDYAVCLHADGQYPPEKIAEFIRHMEAQSIDVLQGSRHKAGTALEGGMPVYKFVAGKVLTGLENLCFGLKLTDYHSGFLLYSRKALHGIPFNELSRYFEFDLEVIACARARGFRIAELGIPTRYAGEVSHLNPIRYGLRVLKVLARYRAGRYRPNQKLYLNLDLF